jgi:hypothetical protein
MPLVLADRVRETTTTTGTGTISLAGPVSGFQGFSTAIGNANTTYYTIVDAATGAWEVGLGTYTSSGSTLARTTVLSSSNSDALVPFGAGTKDVFVTQPAERAVYVLGAGTGLAAGAAAFTANGVPYASATNTLTTGSALTFNGTTLAVSGNATATALILSGNGIAPAGDAAVYRPANDTLGFSTASTERMRIDASGNLTLNTGTFTYSAGTANGVAYLNGSKVLTSGSALTFDGTTFATTGVASIGAGARIQGSGSLSGTGVGAEIFAAGGVTFYSSYNRTSSAYAPINLFSDTYTAFSVGSEQMRLTSTGLGIGTSSPGERLVVSGGCLQVTGNLSSLNRPSSSVVDFFGGVTRFFSIGADSSTQGSFSFRTATTTTNTERMSIDSSGNLGLGVTPSAWVAGYKALQVGNSSWYTDTNGNIQFAANTFQGSGFVDRYMVNGFAAKYEQVNSAHRWYTAPSGTAGNAISFTQAMTLDASGNLLVGTTTNTSATAGEGFKAVFPIAAVPSVRSVGNNSTSSYSTYEVYSTSAAAYRFYVNYAGTVFATTTTISAISDQRLKENIQDLDAGLEAVMALKPRKFDWKAGKGKDIKGDRGWIAQEFEQVFPDMIDTWKDEAPEGEGPYKSVRADLIPVLVKAIQELKADLDATKAELAALKGA